MTTGLSLGQRIDRLNVPLVVIARLAVGGMFAYTAIAKLADPINFLKLTNQYGILPTSSPIYVNLTAVVVPWLELLCAAALILGVCTRGAGLVILGMLSFFTPMLAVHALGLQHDPAKHFATFCAVKFDCGCGTGEVFICRKLAENIVLWLLVLIPLFSAGRRWSLGAWLCRRSATCTACAPVASGSRA